MCQCDSIKIESKLTRRLCSSRLVLTDAMGAIDIKSIANTARAHNHTLSSQFDLLDGTVLLASAIVHRAISNCSSCRLTIPMWGRTVLRDIDDFIIRLNQSITIFDHNIFIFVWRWTSGRRHVVVSLLNLILVSIGVCTFDIASVVVTIFGIIVNWGFKIIKYANVNVLLFIEK